MAAPTEEDRAVAIGCALVEGIRSAGAEGVPGGQLYAVVMGHITIHAFDDMMTRLCRMGLIAKSGQHYYAGPKLPALGA